MLRFLQTIPGMESYADIASSARGLPQMVELLYLSIHVMLHLVFLDTWVFIIK